MKSYLLTFGKGFGLIKVLLFLKIVASQAKSLTKFHNSEKNYAFARRNSRDKLSCDPPLFADSAPKMVLFSTFN